jgi:hypothetical protein
MNQYYVAYINLHTNETKISSSIIYNLIPPICDIKSPGSL